MSYIFGALFLFHVSVFSILYYFIGDKNLNGGRYLVKETKWNMVINPLPFFELKSIVESAHRKEKINAICTVLTIKLKKIPENILKDIKSLNLDQLDFIIDRCLYYENFDSVRIDLNNLSNSKEVIEWIFL